MRAFARLRAPDGTLHELVHGDIIGRLRSAALHLDDGRISEAHAMVSLREQELRLISLRGAFAVDGKPTRKVALRLGLDIQLARGLFLRVEDVRLPDEVLGVESPELPRVVLPPVCSITSRPLRLMTGWVEGAAAHAWCTGDEWSLREGTGPARPLLPGQAIEIDGVAVRFVPIPLAAAGQSPTRALGGVDSPLHIVANFDTVHIQREGVVVAPLAGVLARIVSELVAFDGPVGWGVLAGQLWPQESDPSVLRSRLDANLTRLRRRLRRSEVRSDLVRSDGAGAIELFLHAHDTVEDRT